MPLKLLVRRFVKQPTFTAIAVLTLAIGIGANSAIFAVIDGVLLKPLPYSQPDELVDVDHSAPGLNIQHAGIAPFLYFTYRDEARTLADIGIWRADTATVTGVDQPEELQMIGVTDGVLAALQVRPLLGRVFTRADDSPGAPPTVILTYGYWRTKFGGDPSVIGRRLVLDGEAHEVIGVLPASFRFQDRQAAIVEPLQIDRAKIFLGNFSDQGIARLKPGVTPAQADADLARLVPMALARFPTPPGFSLSMFDKARVTPDVRPLKETVVGDVGSMLLVLMGTVGLVLLIACANVANLLLVRAESRQHEIAIRAALGASRRELVGELLAESTALGVLGGAAGLALAWGGVALLHALAPANLPRQDQIVLNGTTMVFTAILSLAAGVLFGLVPAFKYAGPRRRLALRAEGRALTVSRDRHRARNTLVVAQVALALVLLVGAALMVRTFEALRHVQPGFAHPETLQTLRISIPEAAIADPIAVVRTHEAILEKMRSVPGVSSVALTSDVPMTDSGWHDPVFAQDHVYAEGQLPLRRFEFISPGLLTTMGQPLLAGRDVTWTEVYEKRPVAIVSENLARELWGAPAAAVGKRIRENLKGPWREVIGVAGDVHDAGVNHPASEIVYWPILLDTFGGRPTFVIRTMTFVVRTPRAGSQSLVADLQRAVWSIDANLPLSGVRTMEEVYARSLARTSFALVMLAIAGTMALLLGLTGIYGVISYSVSQRTREIGIRRALGAQNAQVTGMFVRHGARLAAVGIACGLVAAAGLARLMTSLLFDVGPLDPLTYGGVSLLLVTAAVLASYVPALGAMSIDPTEALRAE
jgi:predicted permease